MGVIDKSPAGRSHASNKTVSRNGRSHLESIAAPTGNTVVVAFEFDAMPVDGGGFF
jgi:hypothetical protein